MRLRKLLGLVFAALILIPLVIAGYFAYTQSYDKVYETCMQDLEGRMDYCLRTCEFYNEKTEKGELSKQAALGSIADLLAGPLQPDGTRNTSQGFGKGESGYVFAEFSNGTYAFHPFLPAQGIRSVYDLPVELRTMTEIVLYTYNRTSQIEIPWIGKKGLFALFIDYFEPLDLHLCIVEPIDEFIAPLTSIKNAIIVAGILAAIIGIVLSLIVTNRIAEPFAKLSETSNEIAKGNLGTRVDIKSPIKEFSEVKSDINRMVETIQSNIQELRKREAETKEARLYAEAIIANIADPLWVVDKNDNWVLVNEAMEKATGYGEKEMLGKNTLKQPLFDFFLKTPVGEERLRAMSDKIKAKERLPGVFIPWLTKDKGMLMMSCSGEPLKDAKGNVVGGVFIGKDMSALERAGISASRALNRKVEAEIGKNYELATLMLMSNATLIVGDSSLEILKGVVEGYNRRFNKSIGIEEGIALTNMPKDEWPSFIAFLLTTFFECIGPTTFECSEGIKSIEDIVKKVKAKYES
jgi:PAS domain S-box-containing protein